MKNLIKYFNFLYSKYIKVFFTKKLLLNPSLLILLYFLIVLIGLILLDYIKFEFSIPIISSPYNSESGKMNKYSFLIESINLLDLIEFGGYKFKIIMPLLDFKFIIPIPRMVIFLLIMFSKLLLFPFFLLLYAIIFKWIWFFKWFIKINLLDFPYKFNIFIFLIDFLGIRYKVSILINLVDFRFEIVIPVIIVLLLLLVCGYWSLIRKYIKVFFTKKFLYFCLLTLLYFLILLIGCFLPVILEFLLQ